MLSSADYCCTFQRQPLSYYWALSDPEGLGMDQHVIIHPEALCMNSTSKLDGKVSLVAVYPIPLEVPSTCKHVPMASWDVPYQLTEEENTKV